MASPINATEKADANAGANGPKKAVAEVLAAGTAIGTTVTGVTVAGRTETTEETKKSVESFYY